MNFFHFFSKKGHHNISMSKMNENHFKNKYFVSLINILCGKLTNYYHKMFILLEIKYLFHVNSLFINHIILFILQFL